MGSSPAQPSRHQQLTDRLSSACGTVLAEMGLELVELTVKGSSKKRTVRIDIDRAGPVSVGIQDCQDASRRIGDALDEADFIDAAYTLEVSSPGIDRPIETDDDLRRNTGRKVRAEFADDEGNTHVAVGTLEGTSEAVVRLTDGVEIPRSSLRSLRQEVEF